MHYTKFLFLFSLGPIGDGWIDIAASGNLGGKDTKYVWQDLKHLSSVIRSNQDPLNNSIVFLVLTILLTKYIM